ncbi:CHAT domain-containing protein [Actinophytocola sediminis]
MLFNQLLRRVRQRTDEYLRSRRAETVLCDDALAEAEELRQAAQPDNSKHPTPEDNQRLEDADHALGWLHSLRFTAQLPDSPLPDHLMLNSTVPRAVALVEPCGWELARAIAYLAPHAHSATIPQPLQDVLGASANASRQAELFFALMEYAGVKFGPPVELRAERRGDDHKPATEDEDSDAETTDDLVAIDSGIWLLAASVAATPEGHHHRPARLSMLGAAYMERFWRQGDMHDLVDAVSRSRQAVAATHPDHLHQGAVLSNFNLVVESFQRVLAVAPEDNPCRAEFLSSLAIAYWERFERGGVVADLDHGIKLGNQALDATPNNDPERAVQMSNLCSAYQVRFERGGDITDLEKSTELGTRAVAATPLDHPDRRMRLSNLGGAHLLRYRSHGEWTYLQDAMDVLQEAAESIPEDHPQRASILSNLGDTYRERYQRRRMPADIQQSIELSRHALGAAPDHHHRAAQLNNLIISYHLRWTVGGQGVDSETLRALADQVTVATGPPPDCAHALRVLGFLAHAVGEHGIAVKVLDAAVRLWPLVTPRESGWNDQEYHLGRQRGLVGETVAAHCAIGDPVGAVEAAELGRGILLAAQLDSRSDLTDLNHAHPDLAAEFRRVRDRLNSVDSIERRRSLLTEHDELLDWIRQQPGFTQFLLPPRLPDLQPAAAGGAVILVNTGEQRSDAIIITAGTDPVHVPLHGLTTGDVTSSARAFLEAIHGNTIAAIRRRQQVLPEILGWLWDKIVEPVLSALPPAPDETSTLRRVWWLPTGLLGLFPLHAAGHPGQPGALDTVVSSYTSTLRTLAHARTRPPATGRRQLTVALHHTPGWPDLPGSTIEATTVHTHQPGSHLFLDEQATTSQVLAALPETTWAHFACHAKASSVTPSHSALLLYDAELALPQISQLELDYAELAYLSACSTADRGLQLADESLHLASAFQLAGFRHVIASLWPLNDRIAATAATNFYKQLPATPTADHAATALHHVTHQLRTAYPDRPDWWAALIHNGP